MLSADQIIRRALSQEGDRYVFGAEVPLDADDSPQWDCSELVEWAHAKEGVRVPDGAFNQWRHARRTTVQQGIDTRGALLFIGDGTGTGRDAITHVALSLGDGTTIEARGRRWGVGVFGAGGRFDFAGLVPGVDYAGASGPVPGARPNQGGGILLRRGARGKAVEFWQAVGCNCMGSLTGHPAIDVDGEFGRDTEEATRAVQRYGRGMQQMAGVTAEADLVDVDGVVGPATLAVATYWVPVALSR